MTKRNKTDLSDSISGGIKTVVKNDLFGSDEFRSSKVGYFTGVSTVGKVGKSTVGIVSTAVSGTLRAAKAALFPEPKVKPLPTQSQDPAERFLVAQQMYGRSDADVEIMSRRSGRQFWLMVALIVALFAWGVTLLPTSGSDAGIMSYIFPFFPLFALVPLAFKHAFWSWQLRMKQLGGVRDFIADKSNWVPPLFIGSNRVLMFLLAAISTWTFFPTEALAFDFQATLDEEDLFHQLLMFIAPGVGPIGVPANQGPWAGPLSAAFQAFNTTLLTVGAAMLGWHTFVGTVATAHEGKVLGQRWHTIWAPTRVTLGVGSLAPVANGFCAAQLLVLQLIVWGGGIANEVWKGYLEYFANPPQLSEMAAVNITPMSVQELAQNEPARKFLLDTVNKKVCARGLQEVYMQAIREWNVAKGTEYRSVGEFTQAGNTLEQLFDDGWWARMFSTRTGDVPIDVLLSGNVPAATVPTGSYVAVYQPTTNVGVDGVSYDFTGVSSNPENIPMLVWDYGQFCGSITMNFEDILAVQRYIQSNTTSEMSVANAAVIDQMTRFALGLGAEIDRAVMPQLNNVVNDIFSKNFGNPQAIAEATAKLSNGATQQYLLQAFSNYKQVMSAHAQRNADVMFSVYDDQTLGAVIDVAVEQGWASSGAFYVLLARLQELLWSIGNYYPTSTQMDTASLLDEHKSYKEILFGDSQGAREGVMVTAQKFTMTALKTKTELATGALFTSTTQDEAILQISDFVSVNIYDAVFTTFNPDPYNAMLSISALGHKVITLAAYLLGAMIVGETILGGVGMFLAGATAGTAAGPGGTAVGAAIASVISSVMESAGFLLKMGAIVILAVGVVHAYVLPMMPYILMTFFVMGMLVLTVESLVAAPIWAFFHVRLDGQDFVDQVQRPGYMIAFNLLLRPSLAVFGLILSYVVFGSMIWFTNTTISLAGKAVFMGGSDVLGVLVMAAIITMLHYQIAIRSFTLITQVPDRVTRWFGQGGENLGEQGDAEKSNQFIVAGVAQRTEALGRVGGIKMGGGMGPGAGGMPGMNKLGKAGKMAGKIAAPDNGSK